MGKYEPQKRWRTKNPKARWAHMALASAIRRGLVEPKPCEVCGKEPAEGHHPDYDRPAHVQWLCRKHHVELHAQERKEQDESK